MALKKFKPVTPASRFRSVVAKTEITRKGPERSLKTVRRAIDQLDVVDERMQLLQDRIDDLIESKGPDSPKLRKVRKQLDAQRREHDSLISKVGRAYDLGLKRPRVEPAEPAEPAEPTGSGR